MYCAWCGTPTPSVSYQPCPSCGKPTNGAAQPAIAAPQGNSSAPWIIIVVVILFGVVVIGGILAAIAIPNLLTALQRSRQKRTMADIRSVATAIEAYQTEKNTYPKVQSYDELRPLLAPEYIRTLPAHDGWDHSFRYACTKTEEDRCTAYVLGSGGKDGVFEQSDVAAYAGSPRGATTNFDCDLIYTNGDFVEYPEGVQH
jgi:type II secretory pathway pseudopilin PulG